MNLAWYAFLSILPDSSVRGQSCSKRLWPFPESRMDSGSAETLVRYGERGRDVLLMATPRAVLRTLMSLLLTAPDIILP